MAIAAAALAALGAMPASAAFGLKDLELSLSEEAGTPAVQAGSHPFAMTTVIDVNTTVDPEQGEVPDDALGDLVVDLPPGMAGDATAVPKCSTADFVTIVDAGASCPDDTAIGIASVRVGFEDPGINHVPIYNLVPPPGVPAKVGLVVLGLPVPFVVGLNPEPPYNLQAFPSNISQALRFYGSDFTLWGYPSSPGHDGERGRCAADPNGSLTCPVIPTGKPFLVAPRSCTGPLETGVKAASWQNPGIWLEYSVKSPFGMSGCSSLGFTPTTESTPSTASAETGTGLDFSVELHDEGLKNPEGLAGSDVKKTVVTLPEGMTINPSVGEGLGVCTPADIERETLLSLPGEGCPNSSKLGTLHALSPLSEEAIDGSVFLAQQDDAATTTPGAENPFDSLIALYLVLKNPTLGVIAKLPIKVEPDPNTGQLVATLEDVPQIPVSHFNFHFREGARAPLITPSACGTYTTKAVFTPWANPSTPVTTTSSFQITSGVNGGPCPPGGVSSFHPEFQAGSVNNNAGSFSPFIMRLIREDGEQDMTKFSAILPPGELGSLAGVDKCPDSAVAVAKAKTGRQEIASPSCPANSLIGHTLAGAGVGSALTYVGGQVYLGGPFHGDPLSVIAITPAVAGPFDAGTVVVRLALTLNPKTAEVEVDGANSDPIPHIIKGIVLKLRDLRVYVDRPNFTLNPTSCDESNARSVLFGSYLNVLDPSDDKPIDLATRYQAANCLNLGFKPKLNLNLKGGTKRGGHPGLRAIYTPKKGDANVKGLVVRLPRSAFLDQAHIKTICTRVQFAAKACPKQSQYGYIKAWTPLIEEPLQGPVYLRSSSHKLPDLVFDLHGLVDIEVSTRIDSKGGGIRATVENAPDAPLTKVDLRMQGGKKGLIINSRSLCGHVSKANVLFTGHNGKEHSAKPVMKADCGGRGKSKKRH
jgi:hypothetical protein